jgi:6-phosphogluconolactonase
MEWILLDDAESVAQTTCQRILEAAREAVTERGRFSLVLAGGRTPRRSYELLAQRGSDWRHWHLYFGDERCLPEDHPERNSLMVAQSLSAKVPIPPPQIHPIPAELGPEAAARQYAETLKSALSCWVWARMATPPACSPARPIRMAQRWCRSATPRSHHPTASA